MRGGIKLNFCSRCTKGFHATTTENASTNTQLTKTTSKTKTKTKTRQQVLQRFIYNNNASTNTKKKHNGALS